MPSLITMHWTAGTHNPNATDTSHYHFTIGYDAASDTARVFKNYALGANRPHLYKRNSDNVGISMCGMSGAGPDNFGNFPITAVQVEAMCFVASQIMLISDTELKNVKTHAEWAIHDGYFLDNAHGHDIWGDAVNGDVRWDIILKPSPGKTNLERVTIARNDGKLLRNRIDEYKQRFSDFETAYQALRDTKSEIYKVSRGSILDVSPNGGNKNIGSIITPTVI
jgi:hypothetical protein